MTTVLWVLSVFCAAHLPLGLIAAMCGLRDRYRIRPEHQRFDTAP